MRPLKKILGIIMGEGMETLEKFFIFSIYWVKSNLLHICHMKKNLFKKANIFLIDTTKIRISRKKIYTREIFSKYANFVVQKEKFHQQSCYLSTIYHIKTPKNSVRQFA